MARLAIPVLGVVCALAASPTASAAPAESRLSERIAATTASTLPTVQQSAANATGRVQAVLDELPEREPVTSVVEAVREPARQVASGLAQMPVTPGRVAQAAPPPVSHSTADRVARDAGAIDSNAARMHGAADAGRSGRLSAVPTSQPLSLASSVKASPPTTATASIQSDSDDGPPELPPLPTDGGLANAAGIALFAIAALVALLGLVARRAGQVFSMSPARWEPAVYLTPIERPG